MTEPKDVSRRDFIRQAGAAGLGVPYIVGSGAFGGEAGGGANDKIGVGLIGCGGMGRANLKACADSGEAVVRGVCDVWKERR